MALQGTIKDFGLADILQLIGIQRKTGILSLEHENERVELKFLEGSVVGAETAGNSAEDLLGTVLVRTGRITEQQLTDALATQKQTLQRLGHILVKRGWLTQEDLVEALRTQSLQIIFRLFRWRDGTYQVRLVDDLDYDQQHATPISSETILMEGARMVDEWPIIERRVRSENVVFEQTEAVPALQVAPEPSLPSLLDTEADFDFIFDTEAAPESPPEDDGTVRLSDAERQVLRLIDGNRAVRVVVEGSRLGEFETYRTLADLVARGLLREVTKVRQTAAAEPHGPWAARVIRLGSALVLAAAIGASLYTLPVNPFSPWKALERGELNGLRNYAAAERLERIDLAIGVFFLDTGIFPTALEQLEGDYLRPADLLDPWGRVYGFESGADGYRLFGLDAAGSPNPDLNVVHRYTGAQRMMNVSSDPAP